MARGYGSGRVILVGHSGLLSQSGLGIFDNAQFMKNMLEWLKQTNALQIAYTTGHGEWANALPLQQLLTNTPPPISASPAPITKDSLNEVSVLIVGNAWGEFSTQEVEAIRQFVQNGGGLLLAGLGWSWIAYNSDATIEDYPMHKIASPFGGRWFTHTIIDPTDQTNGYPIFRRFYPNVTSCTPSNAMTTITDAHRAIGSELPRHLETNELLRTRLIGAHAILAAINTEFPGTDPLRAEVSNFYINLALSWQNLYARSFSLDQSTYPTSVWLRERAWRTLRDSLKLTPSRKELLADVVQLGGRQRDLFLNFDLIILDNCRLAPDQLQFLHNLMSLVPAELHDLAAVSVTEYLGTPPVRIGLEGLGGQVNTFGTPINSMQENQFPPDVPAGSIPVYCAALAHEVNHVVDAFTIGWVPNTPLASRRQQLLRDAGTNNLNYLRGMGTFFTANPQEFFASIANQWFADTKKTFDLAKTRADLGITDPINQALFFADVYSGGTSNTYFYRTYPDGRLTRQTVPLSRDHNGCIDGLHIDDAVYSFVLDQNNNVAEILVLSNTADFDGDGLSDSAEFMMRTLGFDWKVSQPDLVAALYGNANRAQLFTQSQFDNNRTVGQQDVIARPSAYDLYDSNSVMDLHMGGLMIQKQGTNATIVLQPQTTTDLATKPFTNSGPPITYTIPMPGDKEFLRVKSH